MAETIMAEVVLFLDSNFGGLHLHLYESAPDLTKIALGGTGSGIGGNWNDKVSSFIILSGAWAFFMDVNYQTRQGPTFGPGFYPSVKAAGIDNDAISSVALIQEDPSVES